MMTGAKSRAHRRTGTALNEQRDAFRLALELRFPAIADHLRQRKNDPRRFGSTAEVSQAYLSDREKNPSRIDGV